MLLQKLYHLIFMMALWRRGFSDVIFWSSLMWWKTMLLSCTMGLKVFWSCITIIEIRLHKDFDPILFLFLSMGKHKPTKQLLGLIKTEAIFFLAINHYIYLTHWLLALLAAHLGHVRTCSFSLDHTVWQFFLKWYFVTKIVLTHCEKKLF